MTAGVDVILHRFALPICMLQPPAAMIYNDNKVIGTHQPPESMWELQVPQLQLKISVRLYDAETARWCYYETVNDWLLGQGLTLMK